MLSQFDKARIPSLVSVVFCIVALVLSFLCLFAGSSKGFMEDYAILTLNTSRIGENVVDLVSQELCSNSRLRRGFIGSLTSEFGGGATTSASTTKHSITQAPTATTTSGGGGFFGSLESGVKSKITAAATAVESAIGAVESDAAHLCNEIADDVGDKLEDVLERIGLHDWYSAHVMDFCEGSYLPGPVPNGTCPTCVKPGTIYKNVTACSNKTAMYHFDPKTTLAEQIKNATDGEIDLTNLHWPRKITEGLDALRDAQKAVFVFYCMAIACIFLELIFSVIGLFYTGRLTALANILIDSLAFLTTLLASSVVTVIAVNATNLINKFGRDVAVSATQGNKFLALTWSATILMFLSGCVWCYEYLASWKRDRAAPMAKYG